MGAPQLASQSPVPVASHAFFRVKLHFYTVGGVRTRNLHYHYTTHSYASISSFQSTHIILHRV
jgi:hypothetical protein